VTAVAARILIVDDSPTNLKLASEVLALSGFAVSTATTAEEALAAIETRTPALVLMDIGLPGMDGLTLTRRLKSNPRYRGLRIVAVTAFAMRGDAQRARDAGCDGYITKPIDTRTFAAQVAAYLQPALADPSGGAT
jgi:CheY-like chemotaxis protein